MLRVLLFAFLLHATRAHVPEFYDGPYDEIVGFHHDTVKISQVKYTKGNLAVKFTPTQADKASVILNDKNKDETVYFGCGLSESNLIRYDKDSTTDVVDNKPELEFVTQSVQRRAYTFTFKASNSTCIMKVNAPNWDGLRAGLVVGTGESFTIEELLSFPIYIQQLHGNWWTQQFYWIIVFYVVGALFALWFVYKGKDKNGIDFAKHTLFYCAFISYLVALVDVLFFSGRYVYELKKYGGFVKSLVVAISVHGFPMFLIWHMDRKDNEWSRFNKVRIWGLFFVDVALFTFLWFMVVRGFREFGDTDSITIMGIITGLGVTSLVVYMIYQRCEHKNTWKEVVNTSDHTHMYSIFMGLTMDFAFLSLCLFGSGFYIGPSLLFVYAAVLYTYHPEKEDPKEEKKTPVVEIEMKPLLKFTL